jgi:hypothetical protein
MNRLFLSHQRGWELTEHTLDAIPEEAGSPVLEGPWGHGVVTANI